MKNYKCISKFVFLLIFFLSFSLNLRAEELFKEFKVKLQAVIDSKKNNFILKFRDGRTMEVSKSELLQLTLDSLKSDKFTIELTNADFECTLTFVNDVGATDKIGLIGVNAGGA